MASIDYMKVIELISDRFNADHKVNLKTTSEKNELFQVETAMANGSVLSYTMDLKKYDINVYIDKKYFADNDIKKWISLFEFDLEQTFLRNIRLNLVDDGSRYTITITA